MQVTLRTTLPTGLLAVAALTGCLGGGFELPDDPIIDVSYASVYVGAFHACGLSTDGDAYCWGSNGFGQLGTGDGVDKIVPRPASGDLTFASLALGGGHTCGLTQQLTAYCWGRNGEGQLGIGTAELPEVEPQEVVTDLDFTSVVTGGAHTCGITPAGTAWCWGFAGFAGSGQLGNGESGTLEFRVAPDSVLTDILFSVISAGNDHTCALAQDNKAYCWGEGQDGQLGNNGTLSQTLPVAVDSDLFFAEIDAGASHTCALTFDGTAYCWGRGDSGQLGIGVAGSRTVPTLVDTDQTFSKISAGGSHTCAVALDGSVYCWGLNARGEIGDGTIIGRFAPVPAQTTVRFESIEAGLGFFDTVTCGTSTASVLYCWGYGGFGQLGRNDILDQLTPAPVAGQPGT